ncbi:Beta-barrel assembly-enhancing protease [Flavobacterium longum]|uniref:tetratricopeptide repeat protein n=1 Tax=Flavobacterium longum TaxID=1299340 RepID=UPI0039E9C10C
MELRKIFFGLAFSGVIFMSDIAMAQVQPPQEPDDIALNTDAFQDSFYEALKQKGIENYDRAVISLEKCLQLQPNNPVIFFELGKNYLKLKQYAKAYEYFDKAAQLDPKNRWYLQGMYDVCYETKDYNKAITIVEKLIPFKADYREDLLSLYMTTQQFDKALDLINQLNDEIGKSEIRDNYKAQILQDAKYQGPEKANLIAQIKKNPKEESNYISLIFLYSESNQEEKAMEVAKQLEKEIPTSDWAQVSLFKFHLNNGEGDAAVKAMNQVLESKKIDGKIKHRILNEFLIFAIDKPQYDAALEKAIGYFSNDNTVEVPKELGKFYQNKKMWDKAARYYAIQLDNHPDDVEAAMLLLQAYTEKGDFSALATKADGLLELFPLQPQFYYYSGLAHNQRKEFKKAKDALEAGLEYLVGDTDLEINMNIQLGEAYNGLGDQKKKEQYFLKAEKLIQQQKKK